MKKINKSALSLLLLVAIFFGVVSCQDDDSPDANPVNQWIFTEMDLWYFWREEMPRDINQTLAPEAYFDNLLFPGDRFSIIVSDFQNLINSLDGVTLEAGYEVSFFRETGTNNVIGAVTYVKDPSPAKDAGIRRGDLIEAVNGRSMDVDNFGSVFSETFQNHSITYLRFNESSEVFEEQSSEFVVEQVIENPNFLDSIYTSQNGKKVGYYVYNFFRRGVNGRSEYSEEMDDIFASFQSAGVEELILDLRYNGGGSVDAAADLASLIAPGVSSEDNLYTNRWNPIVEEAITNDERFGPDFFIGKFLDKPFNIGAQLTADRVYILTGNGTASASELIINGLTPFMDVIIVGDTTVGKNVGSIPLEDAENENNNYGLLPITFQIENSLGQSDYANGFIPGPQYLVNELQIPLKPLGDVEEPLLATALADIDGQLTGRKKAAQLSAYPTLLTSKELKAFKNELILDLPNQ
ncbi:MAG: S41 family peptidase [Bacteroidota bacterium]